MKAVRLCISTVGATLLLAGCAGKVVYTPPSMTQISPTTKIIDQPIDSVWARAVPALSKQFFVINNLDKASGLINVSYSGDPSSYVDCGMISSHVQNARGSRDYVFNGASPYQEYEVMESGQLYFLRRRMALEGRINVVFESLGPTSTRVTANTKYVLTKTVDVRNTTGHSNHGSDMVSFNSGSTVAFPGPFTLECRATGALEKSLLDLM